MIPIHLDLSEVIAEYSLTGTQSEQLGTEIINRVVIEYTAKWEDLVNKGLRKTRNLYKRAMYVDRISGIEVVFGLQPGDSGLALALEDGKEPFDEKIGFAASSKRKVKQDGGWYLTIPFRYATPEALAESEIFQGKLPKEIYDIAKQNNGVRIAKAQLPPEFAQLGQRLELNVPTGVIPTYTHKSPQFEGLVRLDISSTTKEKRGGYFTFRRVSDKSDPFSWWNGGLEARKFMDKALEESQITTVASMAIDEFLNQL